MPKQERKNVEIGLKFGQLEVIENVYEEGVGYLKVRCACGVEEIKRKWPIIAGRVTECLRCTGKIRGEKRKTGYKDISGTILGRLNRNAKTRGLKVLVSPEYMYNLFIKQEGKCALSGIPISIEKINKKHQCTASLDRINSKEDYTESNIQWVHKDINFMKQDLQDDYFIYLCKKVAENNKEFGIIK